MPRPREFDEAAAVAAAARVFREHGYEGTSVDDLVGALGIHRGSLYRTFGSKLELFHRAVREHVEQELLPWARANGSAGHAAATAVDAPDPGLLLVAVVERPGDPVVRAQFSALLAAMTGESHPLSVGLAATVIGLWVLARAGTEPALVSAAGAAMAKTTPR